MTVATGNERQTLATTGTPTGGTITPSLSGQAGTAIAFDANAAAVQAALEASAAIGAGNVLCTGGPLPSAVTCEFRGALRNTNVPQMTATHALTGGTSPNYAIATITPGNTPVDEMAYADDPAPGVNSKQYLPGQTPGAGELLVDADGV